MIRYIIGIDFGHGETTANYVEIINADLNQYSEPQPLSIKPGNEGKKIRSFFCEYRTCEDETTKYDLDPNDNRIGNYIRKKLKGEMNVQFHHSFKVPVNTDDFQETAFGHFVNCVYNNILIYNGVNSQVGLRVNESGLPENFKLYAACPSGWSDEQRDSFKTFLNNNGVPCTKVFKESDAAWITYIPQRLDSLNNPKILVIDYGSSTIDITWSEDNRQDINNPNKLGASRIEEEIYNYLIKNDNRAQEEFDKIAQIIPDDFFVKQIIKLGIRQEKENYYSEVLAYPDDNDHELRGYLLSNTFPKIKGLTYFGDELSMGTINEILTDYNNEVKKYFEQFRNDHMTINGKYESPEKIILTGGASRMDFVKKMICEIFKMEPIIDETKASDSISMGIAIAGVRDFLIDGELLEQLKLLESSFNNAISIKNLIQDFVNTEVQRHVLSILNSTFDRWQDGEVKMDTSNNLNNELISISQEQATLGDTGRNGFKVWDWVYTNAIEKKDFNDGYKSLHALFVEIIQSVRNSQNIDRAMSDTITQQISYIFHQDVENNLMPCLLKYIQIYAPLTTYDDLRRIVQYNLPNIEFNIDITEDSIKEFLTTLVKTAYLTIQDNDASGVFLYTLNKDRDENYRNGYFNSLRNDFESFSNSIKASIPNIDEVSDLMAQSFANKINTIRNYCTQIKILP